MRNRVFLLVFNIMIWTFIATHAQGETIKFREDELARESVLPVFDQPEAVKKRNVIFKNRWQVGAGAGAMFNDPWYSTFPIELDVFYHFNEIHSFGLLGHYHFRTQTQYVSSVLSSAASAQAQNIPFNNSPAVSFDVFGVYQFTPFYGKISFSKQSVMNTTFSGFIGAGSVSTNSVAGVTSSGFGGLLGINQKLFFTKNFGLQLELSGVLYQRTDVVVNPPTSSMYLNTMATVGVVYLMPGMD